MQPVEQNEASQSRISLVTGGQRSGKSSFAQKKVLDLAQSQGLRPLYLATARIRDQEMSDRVARHRADRKNDWDTLESPGCLCPQNLEGRIVLIDCLTLYLSELCETLGYDRDIVLNHFKAEWLKLEASKARIFLVSNEINMGLHGLDKDTRAFQDIQGWANQHAAQRALEVFFMVSGIPWQLKPLIK